MKRFLYLLLAVIVCLGMVSCAKKEVAEVEPVQQETPKEPEKAPEETPAEMPEGEKVLRLTTTTSVNDSGLMDSLLGELKNDTGMKVEIVSKGSGAAIEDGKIGNADVILVHSPAAEKAFVEEGFGLERKTFMHNFFVIVGPKDDPAEVKGLSAEEAFKKILESGQVFVSRGDESGTHKKEENIWKAAGLDMAEVVKKENYNSLGDGMGATLTFASEKQGYTLTDLSTFLSMESDLNLAVQVDQSDSLRNEYSIIVVNPDKVSGTNPELAKEFQRWMTSEKALKMIGDYGKDKYGQALFFVNK